MSGIAHIKMWWKVSTALSLLFVIAISAIWYHVDTHYQPNNDQIISEEAAKSKLTTMLTKMGSQSNQELRYIPTGIFLQSFEFTDSNDVTITGYVWQRFSKSVAEKTLTTANFMFPEQVGGSNDFVMAYKHNVGQETVVGWYFDVTLRQQFNYKDYPLDHKTVWVRIWPGHFDRETILTPALNDYQSTSIGDSFGLDTDIVVGDWNIDETFFDYKSSHYATSFGFENNFAEKSYPELRFNLVLKRKFFNAFIIHLVPLFTVAVLLFALLMTVTLHQSKKESFGFNFTGVISIVSALFFVVMLSHIQLRQQFAEAGIVYIEYFFLLMYFLMISIICNTYFFSRGNSEAFKWITLHDHAIPKLVYWPFTLGVMALVTYLNFCW